MNGFLPVDKNHPNCPVRKPFYYSSVIGFKQLSDRMKITYTPLHVIALAIITSLNSACSFDNNKTIEQFSIVISDELSPKGLLPECMELNSQGKLIFRTSRFNKDGVLYQKNFFIELNKKQVDSVNLLLESLTELYLTPMNKNDLDTVVYKVNIDWMIQGQRSNHLLIGSQFTPPLNQLIAYCQKLPEINHHYKLKESHYFNTDEICSGIIRPK
jgi:hypothetical protein